jgi:hypothetical protein
MYTMNYDWLNTFRTVQFIYLRFLRLKCDVFKKKNVKILTDNFDKAY